MLFRSLHSVTNPFAVLRPLEPIAPSKGKIARALKSIPLMVFVFFVLNSTCSLMCATDLPLGGFLPLVGFGLTDEFGNSNSGDSTFFITKPSNAPGGSFLSGSGPSPYFDVALLDTGAATHILTSKADGGLGFDIQGNGFDGTNIQTIGGATGTVDLLINDPHGIYVAGLGDRTADGLELTMNSSAMRGQTSFATLSAPEEWKLPNIVGLPMAAQHAIKISNDQPQIFELGGRTVRTPQIDLIDLGTGGDQGITRRLPMQLKPGLAFVQGPLYVFGLENILFNPLHENPSSPSVVANGAIFVDVDLYNETKALYDSEMLFDTGADLTVVSEQTAVRLGFDPILDTADFMLQVEGSGGVQDGIPGFIIDELSFDSVGGSFSMKNVPIAVLDVTNPSDPGNVIPGIIGMHLFNGRNLIIDVNPSIGQGGDGPSIYISDPVTSDHTWSATAASARWTTAPNWSANSVPKPLWVSRLTNVSGSDQKAIVTSDSTVFRTVVNGSVDAEMAIEIESGKELTVFADVTIGEQGRVHLDGGKLDAQFVQIDAGTLSGIGDIFVGSGPITTAVRNGAGLVSPGDAAGDSTGKLVIDGDFAQTDAGSLEIDLGGLAVTDYDQITSSRFAFLSGTLEVSLVDLFAPQVGDRFEILTADEGVNGTFDHLILPGSFVWDVTYGPTNVLIEVAGAGLVGDFNASGHYDASDIDMLYASVPGTVPPGNSNFDLLDDGVINQDDIDKLVLTLMERRFGDADLDKDVDITDFNILSSNFGTAAPAGWAQGSFDGDGDVDITDFNLLASNFAAEGYAAAVPEPTSGWLIGVGFCLAWVRIIRRRQ